MTDDREIVAITLCVRALSGLDLERQTNVLRYLSDRNASDAKMMALMRASERRANREASEQ